MGEKMTVQPKVIKRKSKKNPSKISVTKKENTMSVIIPKTTTIKELKETVSAYRSNISNLFSDTDPTLTTQGYMRMFTDTGYYGDVIKCLSIVEQDDLAGGLTEMVINAANTNISFNLDSENEKEEKIWYKWKELINTGLKNTLPGITMLNERILKSLVETSMSVIDFEWEDVTIGRNTYKLPIKMIQYPVLGTTLRSSIEDFGDEEVLVSVSESFYNTTMKNHSTDVAYQSLFVDMGVDESGKAKRAMIKKNAYAIKYKYTGNSKTLYPVPMLKKSFESFALKHKLMDSDMSLLELLINKIIQIKVGDKDNKPLASSTDENGQEVLGDIELAQELFGAMDKEVEVVATPYYYEIKVVMPDATVLMNQDKYKQSTLDILANFGIIMNPNSGADNKALEKINLKNYDALITSFQNHIVGYYKWLALQIINKNRGKIKELPFITFDRPDVYDTNMLDFLKGMTDQGYLDIYTLQEKAGFNAKIVEERLKKQKKMEEDNEGFYDPRPTFKQVVQNVGTKTDSKEISTNK
jgi:hypothetical protein